MTPRMPRACRVLLRMRGGPAHILAKALNIFTHSRGAGAHSSKNFE